MIPAQYPNIAVIPAQAGTHTTRHFRTDEDPLRPSFPRRRESTAGSTSRQRSSIVVIPVPTGIHATRHSHAARNPHHPSFPRSQESTPPVIPAQTKIHTTRHSREGGNPPQDLPAGSTPASSLFLRRPPVVATFADD